MENFEEPALSAHDFKFLFADKTFGQIVEYNAQAKQFLERYCRWDNIVRDTSGKIYEFNQFYMRDVYPDGIMIPGALPGMEFHVAAPFLYARFTLIPADRCIEFRFGVGPLELFSARTFPLDDVSRAPNPIAMINQVITATIEGFKASMITDVIKNNYKSYAHSKR